MKIKFLFFILSLMSLGLFFENAKADVSFSDVGAGATTDDGYTVTDPTVFTLDTSVSTRYIRIEVRNDGTLGDESYVELRSIKAWAGGSTNVLKGIYSGGSAQVVEINSYNGASPYQSNLLVDCSQSWYPQGSLCDESPNADSKTVSSKSNEDSGATWYGGSADDTGVLVIDMGSVQNLTELRVFQMFSDGKTTQIRFAYHPETSGVQPMWDGDEWNTFTDTEGLPTILQEEPADDDEVNNEKNDKENSSYKKCKKKYGSDSYKQDYQKVKYYKDNDQGLYLQMQNVYRSYRTSGNAVKDELEKTNPNTYQEYKEYRRYKKYKDCKKHK